MGKAPAGTKASLAMPLRGRTGLPERPLPNAPPSRRLAVRPSRQL
jgi:hypothetical protein